MDITGASTLMAWLDRELWLVTAQAGGRRAGLIATFVNPASIVPDMPRMLVGLARQHQTWEVIEAGGAFALHLLAEQNLEWVWRFGLNSSRDVNKFVGLAVSSAATGSPILEDSIGWLDCRVEARLDTGDRTVYLAKVLEGRVTHFGPPLTQKRVLEISPAHQVAELKRQLHFDSLADAEAIRKWRQSNPSA
jgi:flavin reductase (DIM6/NTAB) family NADH-FMN oxidoreductase RutF